MSWDTPTIFRLKIVRQVGFQSGSALRWRRQVRGVNLPRFRPEISRSVGAPSGSAAPIVSSIASSLMPCAPASLYSAGSFMLSNSSLETFGAATWELGRLSRRSGAKWLSLKVGSLQYSDDELMADPIKSPPSGPEIAKQNPFASATSLVVAAPKDRTMINDQEQLRGAYPARSQHHEAADGGATSDRWLHQEEQRTCRRNSIA